MSSRSLIRIIFLCEGLLLGLWFPRIAEFKSAADLSLTALALLFLCIPIASLVSMMSAPAVIARFGFRKALKAGALGGLVSLLIIAWVPPYIFLVCAALLMGVTIGIWEIAANSTASRIERQSGPIMATCHGFWSLGMMFGGILVTLFIAMGFGFFAQMLIALPVITVAHYIAINRMPAAPQSLRGNVEAPAFSLPSVLILPICFLPIGGLMTEAAMLDWGAVYLDLEKMASPQTIAWAITVFAGAMALSRLSGDYMRARLSDRVILSVSYSVIIIGLAGWVLLPSGLMTFVATLLMGFGAGNVYPIAISLAGAFGDDSETDKNIAAISMVGFFAFLSGPVIFGGLGEVFGLGIGFLCLIPICIAAFFVIFGKSAQSFRK